MRTTTRHRAMLGAGIVGAAAVAFVLFGRIDAQSVVGDERVYVDAGLAYARGDLSPNPEHPPLAKLILGAWQRILFDGVVAARLLMGLVAIGTAAAIWWMLRRDLGPRAALVPALLVLVADRMLDGGRADRFVTLEAFVALGAAWAFAFAWRWRSGGSVAWIAASGLAMSGACLSKVSAIAMVPAFLVLLVGAGRPTGRRAAVGVAAFAAAGVAAALAVLAPFGGIAAIQAMAEFQLDHAAAGHAVEIDGVVHAFAPWWATLRFALDGVGVLPAVGIVVGAIVAWTLRSTRVLVAMLTTATVVAVAVLSAAPVALAHYFLGWMWMPTALAGIGLVAAVRHARGQVHEGPGLRRQDPRRLAAWAAVGIVGSAAAWSAVASVIRVATIERSPAAVSVEALLDVDREPLVYVPGSDSWDVIAQEGIRVSTDPSVPGITGVIVGDDVRSPPDQRLVALLEQPGTCEPRLVRIDGWLVCSVDGELAATPDGFDVEPE